MTAEGTATIQIQRAVVSSVFDDGSVQVLPEGCDVAVQARFIVTCACHSAPRLVEGARVLVVDAGTGTALILGSVADSLDQGQASKRVDEAEAIPESLVLEATHQLTLRVGDGSITIRKDGKILIKGKDLVSHAQRVNRIKGGSVAIN